MGIYTVYKYGGWSKHSCRCVIRNDLAPALALLCALQGFYCVPLHRLKYVFKNWLPQKVAQFKGVFTDPVRCATQTFLAFGSKIWWFGARILRSWRFWALPTEEIWFPKRPFWSRKKLYGNQISRGIMVEAVFLCVYTILQPYLLKIDSRKVKLLFGSKWPFWESNLLCVYTLLLPHLLNFDSRKAAFLARNGRFGNQTFYVYTLSFYHNTSWNLIPVKLLSGSKGPFWESNFLCVYTLLLPYLLKFDPVKQLSGSKKTFWESNFLCVYILLLPCLWKFDSRKASFWLKRAVLGIKFSLCIHSPSTIPLEIWLP